MAHLNWLIFYVFIISSRLCSPPGSSRYLIEELKTLMSATVNYLSQLIKVNIGSDDVTGRLKCFYFILDNSINYLSCSP